MSFFLEDLVCFEPQMCSAETPAQSFSEATAGSGQVIREQVAGQRHEKRARNYLNDLTGFSEEVSRDILSFSISYTLSPISV